MTVRQCRNPCLNFWGVSGDKREAVELGVLGVYAIDFFSLFAGCSHCSKYGAGARIPRNWFYPAIRQHILRPLTVLQKHGSLAAVQTQRFLPVINYTWTPQTNVAELLKPKTTLAAARFYTSYCIQRFWNMSLPHVSASVHVRKPPFISSRFRLRSPRSASDTRIRNTDFIRPRPPQKPRSWSCLYSNVVHHHVIYIPANSSKQKQLLQ